RVGPRVERRLAPARPAGARGHSPVGGRPEPGVPRAAGAARARLRPGRVRVGARVGQRVERARLHAPCEGRRRRRARGVQPDAGAAPELPHRRSPAWRLARAPEQRLRVLRRQRCGQHGPDRGGRRAGPRPRAFDDARAAAAGVPAARRRGRSVTHARPRLGAAPDADGRGTRFAVWAPHAHRVDAVLLDPDEVVALASAGDGIFAGVAAGAGPGRRYRYRLDGGDELPDPASSFQPEGVAGPSAVVAPWDGWTDAAWRGMPLPGLVLYELHVGTFTPEGTFDAIVPRLAELRALGVTAIELMPVAQFPGPRNWGYDGVFPSAV